MSVPHGDGDWRMVTDHPITQLPWWGETLRVVPPRRTGRLLAELAAAWHLVAVTWNADTFISGAVRNTFLLALAKRILRRSRPVIVLTEMRLDDPRPGWRWSVKVWLQRFAFRAVERFCVSSRREILEYAQRLGVPPDRFRFVPWHTNVLQPAWHPPNGYVFAAGRTGRDWRTFAEAAATLDVPMTVVCSRADIDGGRFPSNVTALADVPYDEYRRLLEGARVVVVPLEPHVYSSGQVVVLEAMALGKPVIASRVLGTEDYIEDGVNGVLVEPLDADGLRCAIRNVYENPAVAERLGRAALEDVREDHTLEQYARRVITIAREATSTARVESAG